MKTTGRTEELKPLVIYHAHCWDGFCAAWLFHRAYPNAEYLPAQYGEDAPDVSGRDVFMFDFSYPRDVLRRVATAAKTLTVLDHHATAQKDLEHFADGWHTATVTFDMSKSGGRLAWEFLQDAGALEIYGASCPWLVDYTEDRDLWRFALPNSKAINAAVRSFPLDFAEWDSISARGAMAWAEEGYAIMRREEQIIAEHVERARLEDIGGHSVPVVNATTLFSDIAGELAKGQPFAACYFDRADGKRQYSLRSGENGVDVSLIAQQYGGGGHKHAAGFAR